MFPERNGMFRTKRLDQQRSSRGFVILLVVAFFVIGTAWFIFSSGFWNVSTVEINGLQSMDRGEVTREVDNYFEQRNRFLWKGRNLLMLDAGDFTQTLKDRLFIANVTVDKVYPSILRLMIEERQRSVILVSNEQFVNVDTTGVVTSYVIEPALSSARDIIAARSLMDSSATPVIIMNADDPLAPGFQIAAPEQIKGWLDTFQTLLGAGLKIRFMKIQAPDASLARFVSDKGYDIYFDLKRSLEGQLATYLSYMRSGDSKNPINYYIDVRIPGRVFIK
jgi:hypothetical protein